MSEVFTIPTEELAEATKLDLDDEELEELAVAKLKELYNENTRRNDRKAGHSHNNKDS